MKMILRISLLAVAFAAIPATAGDLETKVRKLREALEPQAQSISDIPPYDLKLAYDLYALLLKPVEAGWKQSKQLIVVTNGESPLRRICFPAILVCPYDAPCLACP